MEGYNQLMEGYNQLMEGYNQLTEQRRDGREGGVSKVDETRPMGMPGVGHVMSSHPRL